jgi:hypothetical protein
MRINELIERLQEIQEDHGNIEVRGAFQPRYPLLSEIQAITTLVDTKFPEVFIALGDGDEYGSKKLWDDCEVSEESDDDEDAA